MADQPSGEPGVTELLIAWSSGRPEALEDLIPLVYQDLRRVAAAHMRREGAGHPLQTTALVHEAYVRLIDQRRVEWRGRAHFLAIAAGVMRRILVDLARRRRADKRGGDWQRITLTGHDIAAPDRQEVDVLALHDALERLAALDARQAQIVELRYFGGLTIEETAEAVATSAATVVREWTFAKAWLRVHLSRRP
jgi:RNA polymerase sigma-70 factor (ECF subfamily)